MAWMLTGPGVKEIQGQRDGRVVCRISMEALVSEQPAHKKSSETQVMHPVLSCGVVWSLKLNWRSTAAAAWKPSEAVGGGAALQLREICQKKTENSSEVIGLE
eukprot:superscaffoldBa00001571_g11138